ncbi:ATP-grasp domain-containing protein [Gelidibacter algens]|uniref:ATP-grasp domain-containing protein n=1 Tax=Gelidibacter algens TaxID=49280 RepID=A0A1A7R249_9FLAO|nr:ATP-grasp domain-containing protein [Gelidibacter algens]OBX25578.1 ATPase [Gelidibacter algens]RAJ27884.1 ATP-grasp domain-containing protein [Gelidibacter algens]
MSTKRPLNFLCVTTYHKGADFIKSCKAEGNNVYLLTKKKLEHEMWPWEAIDDVFYVENWNQNDVTKGIAYKFRTIKFDRFVALDDFDVEKVALLREHFRMPGMGRTTSHYFRDKLAMRMKAQEEGVKVPEFTALFHDEDINAYADSMSGPWLLKPRLEASATGIKKINNREELWQIVNALQDERDNYLIEKFAPGDVYHVDGLNVDGKVVFSRVSKYLDTPLEVAHGGGVFRSATCKMGSKIEKALTKMNADVMKAFGMQFGASHTEFIASKDTGELFFLETSSRVGGANLAEMVELASGINLWGEWARIESATLRKENYKLPKPKNQYAGIVVSLSRFENPDTSSFNDAEIAWRMNKKWHIGMIVVSDSADRVMELLDTYTKRIASDFHASIPAPDKSL